MEFTFTPAKAPSGATKGTLVLESTKPTKKKTTYKYGETTKGKQRGIKVNDQDYDLRTQGQSAGKKVNVHESGVYVGKESLFYYEMGLKVAAYHFEHGTFPPKGTKYAFGNAVIYLD